MYAIKPSQIKDFIKPIAINMNDPVMLWGPPGCGKSEIIYQLADELGAVLVDLRLSYLESVDLHGYPKTYEECYQSAPTPGGMVWVPPLTIPFEFNERFPTDRPIILFLDELTNASASTLAVAYQLINDRAVGEHKLMSNVRIIAAGNREGDKGVTTKMPLPLANRMVHVEVEPDAQSWIDHHLDTGGSHMAAAYFTWRPSQINTFDPNKPAKSFGTYRSWTKAWKYMASNMPRHIRDAAIAGAVGDGEAAEMIGFVEMFDSLPDINDILSNPSEAPVPDNIGAQYAVAVSMVRHMDGKKPDELEAIATYIERLPQEIEMFAWITKFRDKKDLSVICSSVGAKKAKQYWDIVGDNK